jgi:hypothetical protein
MSYCDFYDCNQNSKQRQIFIKIFTMIMMIAVAKTTSKTTATTKTKAETTTKTTAETKTTMTPVNSNILSHVSVNQEPRLPRK